MFYAPRYNPAAILSSFPPVRCMIKKFLPIPLFSLDERGIRRLRTRASDIFFDKKYPRLPEIVAGEGVTRRLIDAPRAPQSQLFYENGIPRRRRPQVINPSNTPRPSPLSRQSLWLPHGSACPSHEEQKPAPTDRHDILLGLLAIIFVLVLIVVFIAAIVILADRIRTLWRETKGAGGCGDVERGLLVSSWGRRVRRKRRTRTMT